MDRQHRQAVREEKGSFEFLQIQEFDDSCEELAAGIKCLKEILETVAFMRENNYYLRSSSNMRSKALNTLHAFTIKTATVQSI